MLLWKYFLEYWDFLSLCCIEFLVVGVGNFFVKRLVKEINVGMVWVIFDCDNGNGNVDDK